MKKRVVAILLSFTLCSAMVTEAGAAVVADPVSTVSEDIFSDQSETVTDEQDQTGEAQTEVPEMGENDNVVVEGVEDGIDGSSDIIIDDNGEDNTEEIPPTASGEPELDFGDDLFSSGDSLTDKEPNQQINAMDEVDGNVVSAAASFETEDEEQNTATLLYTRWESENGQWKLKKIPKVPASVNSADEAGTEEVLDETTADGGAVQDSAVSGDLVSEETVDSASEADVQVETETAPEVVPETEVIPEAAAVAEPLEYYKNQLVTVKTVDMTGKILLAEGTYYFDENGYLVTGRKTIKNGTDGLTVNADTEFYFLDSSKANVTNTNTEAGKNLTPFNSHLGQMQKGYWLWDENAFHNYGTDGCEVEIAGNQLYKINGEFYYLRRDGKPFVGVTQAVWNGRKSYYCFAAAENENDIPGKMGFERWGCRKTSGGEQWLYFGASGRFERRYAGVYKLLSYKNIDTEYLIDHNGYIVRNKAIKANNGYYYMANGSGHIYKDCVVKYGNYRYYYIKDGRRVVWKNRWIQIPSGNNKGHYYYLGNYPGRVDEKHGIHKVVLNNKFIGWFLFDSNGNNVQDRWADDRYYLPDGRMASGPVTVGRNKYFFARSSSTTYRGKIYKNQWIKYNDKFYYAIKDGKLCGGGWKNIDGGRYYFENWTAVTSTVLKDPSTGKYGWLDSRGKYATEWIAYNNSKNLARYLDPKTGRLYQNTTRTINGVNYRFDRYGNRVNDRTKEFRQSAYYYVECDRVNGVMTIYANSSKTTPIKTIRVSVGLASTPTPVGTYTINRAERWQPLMGPSWGQYGSHVTGGIFIHSVASGLMNGNNLPAGEYLKLGNPASHGCIRCCVADSKWVWENCNGSRIRIFDGKYNSNECFKGPLGRNPLTPLRGSGTFDPTDPDYN